MSDWADELRMKAREAIRATRLVFNEWEAHELEGNMEAALRDVQLDTAKECLRLAEALYDSDGVTNERICAAIRERFLKGPLGR